MTTETLRPILETEQETDASGAQAPCISLLDLVLQMELNATEWDALADRACGMQIEAVYYRAKADTFRFCASMIRRRSNNLIEKSECEMKTETLRQNVTGRMQAGECNWTYAGRCRHHDAISNTCKTTDPCEHKDRRAEQKAVEPADLWAAYPPPAGETWHNPDKLTPEQIEVESGWRLELESECTRKAADLLGYECDRQMWIPKGGRWVSFAYGNDPELTYRTRDPLPVEKTVQPICPKCGKILKHHKVTLPPSEYYCDGVDCFWTQPDAEQRPAMPAPRDGYHATEWRIPITPESFYSYGSNILVDCPADSLVNGGKRWIAVKDAPEKKPVVRWWRGTICPLCFFRTIGDRYDERIDTRGVVLPYSSAFRTTDLDALIEITESEYEAAKVSAKSQ